MRLDITPIPKPRMTQRDRWAKRAVVLRYFAYCDALREALPDYRVPAEIRLEFGIPMPKSWSQKRKDLMRGKPHQQKPDVDNLCKAFLDALCKDDSYVWHTDLYKYWADVGYVRVDEI